MSGWRPSVRASWLAATFTLILLGCQSHTSEQKDVLKDNPPPGNSSSVAVVKVQHLPPTAKDVIDVVLSGSQIPLAADPSCHNAGTEGDDKTIGRYLSGFLAELSDPKAQNAIETSVETQQLPTGEAVWQCRMMVRHALKEDIWRWGVQFSVQQKDGRVKADSFRCVGAG
jgi:hypothetical protein